MLKCLVVNILFVCTQNRWRSLTAEQVFKDQPGWSVRSAGTASNARVRVNSEFITWADHIFVMEKKHQEILHQKFPVQLAHKKLFCLNIPDDYEYMDEDLIMILKESVGEYIQ